MTKDQQKARRLARRIAKALFTNVRGDRADTLTLFSKEGKNLGGWAEMAVVYQIEDILLKVKK